MLFQTPISKIYFCYIAGTKKLSKTDRGTESFPKTLPDWIETSKWKTIGRACSRMEILESKTSPRENPFHEWLIANRTGNWSQKNENIKLENEIASLQQKIEERENKQIEVLLKIDGARETAELAQGKITQRVAEMEISEVKGAIGEEKVGGWGVKKLKRPEKVWNHLSCPPTTG